MIYTVTLNPSIDLIVHVEDLQLNKLNRMQKEQKFPGGKGINVSRILQRIGVDTTPLGFIGGFTGQFIMDALSNENITHDFVQVEGDSRINLKLKSLAGETEINGQGPVITPNQYEQFLQKLTKLKSGDTLVLAGSIPKTIPVELYKELLLSYTQLGVRVVVDTSGEALKRVIDHRPFLIKPNHHELGELFQTTFHSIEEIIPYGKRLQEKGVAHLIVSMADKGALLFTQNGIYQSNVPQGKVVNSVGAGDSVVAGFIGRLQQTNDVIEAFRFGIATGSATAFSPDLASKEKIAELYPQVEIKKIGGEII
ncbi:1-phosphofructokinase [Risungbinella massiliensis]|uniref:1-phosphofructokinase n=1 Tax=Risungbinella massiliensis TaxID=1329796 RepID=UPI0005CC19BF|nr:1-phosphofructokinase [Risungbinella massiliensis]